MKTITYRDNDSFDYRDDLWDTRRLGVSDHVFSIEERFKELLKVKRFRSVSVKEICEGLEISRKTFYAYFDSKEAIVDYVFRRDVLQPAFDLGRLLSNAELEMLHGSVFERMFQAVRDDGEYYRNLVVPMRGNDSTFQDIATAALFDLYSRMLVRLGQPATTRNAEYVVSYFASAHAAMIIKWICDDYPVAPNTMVEIYDTVAFPFWKTLSGGGV